jgi:hypothetical protein
MSQADISNTLIRSRRAVLAGIASVAVIPSTAALAAVDPVYAAIERHKKLSIAYDHAVNHPAVGDSKHPEYEEKEVISGDACHALLDHAEQLFSFKPTTSAGVIGLLSYISTLNDWEMPGIFSGETEVEGLKELCRSIASAFAGVQS